MNAPDTAARQALADTAVAARRRHDQLAHSVENVSHHLRGTSLNRALDAVGDWWTQCILREAFLGVRNFEEFQSHLGIPRQTLSQRLKSLVAHGIFDVSRGGYRLTPRGLALYPWALMIWRWTRKWGGDAGPVHPRELVHHACGHVMTPVFACGECLEEVTLRDIDYEDAGTPRRASPAALAQRKRWTGGKTVMDPGRAGYHIAFITADRWTHLILGAVFLGCRSFDRIEREIGISTNILSQRLALLQDTGFLVKKRSSQDARRYLYGLTPRSRDVFPLTISLVQWADEHLTPGVKPPIVRHHRACGARLHAQVICSHCRGELLPREVGFKPLAPPG
jgi:DNA-binding HxlR family transcriptional regulator